MPAAARLEGAQVDGGGAGAAEENEREARGERDLRYPSATPKVHCDRLIPMVLAVEGDDSVFEALADPAQWSPTDELFRLTSGLALWNPPRPRAAAAGSAA
jgi:hypothetical protein